MLIEYNSYKTYISYIIESREDAKLRKLDQIFFLFLDDHNAELILLVFELDHFYG